MMAYGKRRKKAPYFARKKPKSPSRRKTPWVTLTVRAEHYAMLRELSDYNKCTISMAAMVLIEAEFMRVLNTVDPEKAKQIEHEIETGHLRN